MLIFDCIVERTNTKTLEPFFAISILNPNYDLINDVISGFAKVFVQRCGFHCRIAQTISWGEVVSVFLYPLYFQSYDVINHVIMSDADCTPGRELRSVAASFNLFSNHKFFDVPEPIFEKVCDTTQYVLKLCPMG